MLTIWRRHSETCPHREKGRDYLKCSCSLWADGYIDGRRIRESLGTRDMAYARKKISELEASDATASVSVQQGIMMFLDRYTGRAESTKRNHRITLSHLEDWCKDQGISSINDLTTENLDDYRSTRPVAPHTADAELKRIKQFFKFCLARKWCESNPAKDIEGAKHLKPNEIVPYTPNELTKILAACDALHTGYARARAKGFILLLRYTALRMGDVSQFERDRISWDGSRWRIFIRTEKTGEPVHLPIPDSVKLALDAVPIPRGAAADCKHFFWSGRMSVKSLKMVMGEMLRSVFHKSGVPKAHAHRFRHTLATELLGRGVSYEEVADILGNSAAIVRKHYAKWSVKRQQRIDQIMDEWHSANGLGTIQAQTKKAAVS